MNEVEVFLSEFYRVFRDVKFCGKKIVLYGTGYITKWVLDDWKLGNELIGICDFNYSGATFEGHKVIKEREMSQVKSFDFLIIMNRNPSIVKSIFNRIQHTLAKNVLVVDTHGKIIEGSDSLITETRGLYTHAAISRMLKKADVVSFDIFDTLITRNLPEPSDLFHFLSYKLKKTYGITDFVQKRREAEHIAVSRHLYPTLDEIYQVLVKELLHFSEPDCVGLAKTLRMEEICAEKYFIRAKTINVNLLCEALREGKEVYILSDTFFTKDEIIDFLLNAGIDCIRAIPLDHFFLSCEMGASKEDGSLWDIFQSVLKGHRAIHVGDNLISDIKNSERIGIQAVYIPSSHEKWTEFELSERQNILSVIQQGILQNGLLNNGTGNCKIQGFYDYGYYIIAPLIFNYLLWILKEVTSKGGKTVYFFSRDGFFLQKLFNQMSQAMNASIRGKYLYLSRTFLEYLCFDKEERRKIRFFGTLEELLKYRFNIECTDVEWGGTLITPGDDITPYISKYDDDIDRRRKLSRTLYREYLERMGIYKQSNGIHIVDPSYKGTGQYLLSSFLNEPIEGYYCYADLSENNSFYQKNMYAFYQDESDETGTKAFMYQYHAIFEASIMVSPEGSVRDIQDEGFLFTPLGTTQKNFQNKWRTYNGVKNFFLDVMRTVNKFDLRNNIMPDSLLPVQIFEKAMNNTFEVSTDVKNSIYTDNYYDQIYEGRLVSW